MSAALKNFMLCGLIVQFYLVLAPHYWSFLSANTKRRDSERGQERVREVKRERERDQEREREVKREGERSRQMLAIPLLPKALKRQETYDVIGKCNL